ncbi:MAG: beta-glucosidase [Acidobacteriota bacterium]|nr:beta-glucosidase [Acidobacteriota bacterium]
MNHISEANSRALFRSFFLGGFECSTHRNRAGCRLDLIDSTRHDKFARADYERLRAAGIRAARDGLRWHLIERQPYQYDFSSLLPLVQAARESGVQVIWDLFHYGWPDDLDIFAPEFIDRLAGLARALAKLLREESDDIPFIAPVNEISFFAWAAGDVGVFFPYANDRGHELKRQIVRAAIAAIEAIRDITPQTRIVHTDPLINVIARTENPHDVEAAESYCLSQHEALDMLSGRLEPQLGGNGKYLDIIGVNYYLHNQWFYPDREMIPFGSPHYRPLRELLSDVYDRYRRPIFIAETGVENDLRTDWFRYVGDEAHAALRADIPLEGVCLYPILNHPGWDDDRHCYNGLWDYADENGHRDICESLLEELHRQQAIRKDLNPPGIEEKPHISFTIAQNHLTPSRGRAAGTAAIS